jgi:predicted RNA-binding protein with PIN domain
MIVVKAKIDTFQIEEHTFVVEAREALITLLQMLEQYEHCKSFVVFNSTQFEKIVDLKTHFNISNQSFTKFQS